MQEYQQRVVDEKIALEEKLVKLSAFLLSEIFLTLDNEDRFLLSRQKEVMSDYLDILVARIKRFSA